MRFRQLGETSPGSAVSYEMEEDGEKTGTFSWHIQGKEDFWIDRIRFFKETDTAGRFGAVLEFLRYKAGVSGCRSIYMRVSAINHSLQQRLLDFGFYKIDEETQKGIYGEEICTCIMKLQVQSPGKSNE